MASSALEEKINKIRQQNEEIRRRYKEVEEDKKNAAKLNALVQMVPSTDWPERKEPPEFSNPPKAKPKPAKEKLEYIPQAHPNEGKKIHTFAQGEGPPPDPKYNFLADSEREEPGSEYTKEPSGNRSHNRVTRGNFRKKAGGREPLQKDNKIHKGNYRDESQPGYDAWRAERNRIDEDRISRQRTAEGNWRREWDNDKVHILDDAMKKTSRPTLSDFTKKDCKDSDRRYHTNNNEHMNHNRGNHRPYRGSSKNFYGNHENRSHNTYDQHRNNSVTTKAPLPSGSDERTVVATDKSLKVTVNQGNSTKGLVMSVKVNSPSIAGTGRVGPRQRTRVTYSHSDAESPLPDGEPFFRQKSFEDKSKGNSYNNPKSPNIKRSHSQKKKDGESKYSYHQRKELKEGDNDTQRQHENDFRSTSQKDSLESNFVKSPKLMRENTETMMLDSSNTNSPEQNDVQECLNPVFEKIGNNVSIESNETMESSKLSVTDQVEVSNEDNDEVNDDKNEITNEVTTKKEVQEVSVTSPFGLENSERIEDDVNKETSDENSEHSLANDSMKDSQEKPNTSSAAVFNNVESIEEVMPNESNTSKLEEALSKNDEQSVENISEQLVTDDCDTIKDEVTDPVSSLEVDTHSVIEINNQPISNNESMQAESSILENNELSNTNPNVAADCSVANTKNTLSDTDIDKNPTEENNEKVEEKKGMKEES